MDYVIRECESYDAMDIYLLNREEMGYDYPFELTQKKINQILLSESDKIYVAVCNDKVIGYVHANSYDVIYSDHMKNIMGIAVASIYQRNGIGKALLLVVEKWAKEDGAIGVRLVSGSIRKKAHDFYRKCGYSNEKEQINFKKVFE